MERMRAAIMVSLLLAGTLPALSQDKLPEGPGKAAMLRVCKGCHPPEIVAMKHHTREEWEEVVTKMVLYYLHERAWSRVSWGRAGHRSSPAGPS